MSAHRNLGWVATRKADGFTAVLLVTITPSVSPRRAAEKCVHELTLQGLKDIPCVYVGELHATPWPGEDASSAHVLLSVTKIQRVSVSPVSGVSRSVTG